MRRKTILVSALVAVCALSAVATALASSGSARHARSHSAGVIRGRDQAQRANSGEGGGPPAGGTGGPGGLGGGPGIVHAEGVMLDKAGTGYITFTTDSGTVKSVEASAGKLTILEGTKSVTYKTLTLSIPSEAKVTLDGKSSSLSSLAEGDHVVVMTSSEGTTVNAGDSSAHPEGGAGHGGPPPSGEPPKGGETA